MAFDSQYQFCSHHFIVPNPALGIKLEAPTYHTVIDEPKVSKLSKITCRLRYSFMSPQCLLCGFLARRNLSMGSLLSKSQSLSRYSFLASVLVMRECLVSPSRQASHTLWPNLSYRNDCGNFFLHSVHVGCSDSKRRGAGCLIYFSWKLQEIDK